MEDDKLWEVTHENFSAAGSLSDELLESKSFLWVFEKEVNVYKAFEEVPAAKRSDHVGCRISNSHRILNDQQVFRMRTPTSKNKLKTTASLTAQS